MLRFESGRLVARRAISRKGQGSRQSGLRIDRRGAETEQPVVLLGLRRIIVPAHSEIDGEFGRGVKVVLEISVDRRVRGQSRRSDSDARVIHIAQQEAGERVARVLRQPRQSGLIGGESKGTVIG